MELSEKEWDEADLWSCTACGRIGSVGRCCGEDTREPVRAHNTEFKSLLSRAGLNQTEASKYLKITRRQVVNYCNGTTKPRHWVVEKLEDIARGKE